MKLEEYTDDNICSALWLGQFEPVGAECGIRLLLKPSFHPETCVTVEPTRLHAVSLNSMLWHESDPRGLLKYDAAAPLAADQFAIIAQTFERALAENAARTGKWVTIDGMPVSALRIAGARRSMFKGQPFGPEQMHFVQEVLRLAHASVSSIHLRNRIAQCGQYMGLNWEIEPEPRAPSMTRLIVLGAPDDRSEYFDQLQNGLAARPPA